ncbi:ABC-type multidrug transport system, ATPase and permease component [Jatrophihabitans endophyticus]|uniref:ABC-type multidrug transport system, ATPase and permease component n=1 Tax=Jatrophihabitans endophyticus TaxID=1206085 RepID=A0A1M5RIJ1_9ACTN|nr:ABC transporter ATP-binding protein [Jatrophihabitans endophyticus]SHH25990.1 ABC-type multidrug transport system, ATPase and permease component [Jatrophihabitans endophyticus]
MSAPAPPAPEQDGWHGRLTPETDAQVRADDAVTAGTGLQLHAAGRTLLRELVRPYRRQIAAVLLVALAQVAATMAAPWLIGVAIDDSLPAARRGDYTSLTVVGAALVVSALLSGTLRAVFVVRSGRVGQAILFDLRRRGFDHVQSLSVAFHERFTSGRVISRLTSDVDTLTELLDSGLDGLLTALFNSVAIAVLLLFLDVPLGLLALASLLPLVLLYRWFSPRAAEAFRGTREKVATMIVEIVETFNGIRAVQAFRREKRNDAIFARLNGDYREANKETFRLQAWFIPGTALIGNVATVAILLVGGFRVAHGGLELGVLTSFLLYLRQFYDPMEDVGVFYNSLQSATAAMAKIAAVLAERPSVPEPDEPVALPRPVGGAIDFDRVEFGYDAARPVLHRLELTVPAGQTVALVGATGAGKTTIAKLVSRFYDPTAGRVGLDGVDLRDVADAELRRAVVMITQDGFLFSGSVADNIAFGRLGATRDEVVAAAKAVGAHAFVESLPEGYDTDVRKRGGRLSAGQRQLVAFARAFLADPAVLILDEATSSLDVPTERAVQQALRTVLASRTALIIAHRLSTVEIADRVLVLADGRIVEDGAPQDLVAAGEGHFAELHTSWRDSLV